MTQKKKKRIIVVLGMHRSGTSVITRGLAALGVDLGKNLLPPAADNESGFWEDQDIYTLNRELLAFLGHDWHTLTPIQPAELERPDLAAFKLRAVELLRKKIRGVPVFGMKDPRTALLLPFWQDVFRHIGAEVSYVIAVRHPLSVVRSLNKRNGFDPEKSYYLWLEHMAPCMLNSEGSLRVVVDFDLLMEQPEPQLRRMAEVLGLHFDARTSVIKEYINEFLRDDLRHTRFHLDDLKLDPSVPQEAASAFELLDKLSNDRLPVDAPEVHTFFQTLEQHLATLRPAFNYMTRRDGQLAGLQQNLTAQNQTLAERDQALAAQIEQIAERTSRISELSQAVAERDGKIATLSQAVVVKDQSLVKLDEQVAGLSKGIAEHNDKVANLNREVVERDGKIATLGQAQVKILADRDAVLTEINQTITALRVRNAVLNQNVIERDQTLAGRDVQISSLNREINDRDTKITILNRTVIEKDEQIAKCNEQIADIRKETSERDGRIASLTQTLSGRTKQIVVLNQTINEQILELAALQKQVAALDQTIAEQTAVLADREAQITGFRQEAAKRDRQIAILNQTITQQEATLAGRDIQIDGLGKNINGLTGQIADLTQTLTDRDAQIAALNQTIIERDLAVANRDIQVGGLNQAVAERDGRIGQLERKLSDVQALLNSVLASPSWKITEPLRWFRRNLITRPARFVRRKLSAGERAVWYRRPFSSKNKQKIKNVLFSNFPTFLSRTQAYHIWENGSEHHLSGSKPTSNPAARTHSRKLKKVKGFNATWYLRQNADVLASGMCPYEHYTKYGKSEGRLPAPQYFWHKPIERARQFFAILQETVQHTGGLNPVIVRMGNIFKKEGLTGLNRRLSVLLAQTSGQNDYTKWVRLYDTLDEAARERIVAKIKAMPRHPKISIVLPVYDPPLKFLDEAIRSVRKQLYSEWELCIADDASKNEAVRNLLKRHAAEDSRIRVIFRKENGHISKASNSALELVTGEFIALMDNDDLIPEHALFYVAQTILSNSAAALIYSDEDKISQAGKRTDPYFKCDWNPDLFRSQNMISHLGVYRADIVSAIGGFRAGYEGSQDYDLAARFIERISPDQIVHIPRVLYHWRILPGSTALSGNEKSYAHLAGQRALQEHLSRLKVSAEVKLLNSGMYHVRYTIPASQPMVSLIIPTRNGVRLLKRCVESILDKTVYRHYEILIVDNGSDDPETLRYFAELAGHEKVSILRDDGPFNFSALNNAAVKKAHGEFVGLINNDIEVISPEWLDEMVGIALQPGVGAVGARLWYPNNTLQHGGIITGLLTLAGHAHKNLPRGHFGYFARASITQSMPAVTAACLVIRKSIYKEVGGLDEENLKVGFNDVDFCLKLRQAGYHNVWTPHAELYHHESASRGQEDTPEKTNRFRNEVVYMQKKWAHVLPYEPAYSPNLALDREDFSLAWPPRVAAHGDD